MAVRVWLGNVAMDVGPELEAAGVPSDLLFPAFAVLFSSTYQ